MLSSPNRLTAVIVGALYLVFGVAGFFVAAPAGIAGTGRLLLGIFSISAAGAAVDILIAAALMTAVRRFGDDSMTGPLYSARWVSRNTVVRANASAAARVSRNAGTLALANPCSVPA